MPDTSSTEPKGWVYIIVNDLIPARIKIGYTSRDPIDRAYELITTGTTGTFVVIYQAYVPRPYEVEQAVHKRLAAANCGLEWFEICPNRAKEEILAVAGAVLYEETTPRWHRSQREPSERTKELLHEAKKAADERRRQAEKAAKEHRRQVEEAERAARIAAEAKRVREAEAAEEERRRREAEQARQRAEEVARAARLKEQERLRQAEYERWVSAFARHCVVGLGLSAALLATLTLLNTLLGPYSSHQIDAFAQAATAAESQYQAIRAQYEDAEKTIRDLRIAVTQLPTKELELTQALGTIRQKEKQARNKLNLSETGLTEAIAHFNASSPSPRPTQGVSLREEALKLRRMAVEKDRQAVLKIEADRIAIEKSLRALPAERKALPQRQELLAQSMAQLKTSHSLAETHLKRAESDLAVALRHNRRFPWATQAPTYKSRAVVTEKTRTMPR